MKSNFNALLVALAALDSGVVATGIWDYSVVKVIYIELYITRFRPRNLRFENGVKLI